jgi:hypothetical protein
MVVSKSEMVKISKCATAIYLPIFTFARLPISSRFGE